MPPVSTSRARRGLALALAMVGLAAMSACDYAPDGTPAVVVFAGSPVTEDFTDKLVASYLPDPDPDDLQNVHAVEPLPRLVPGDPFCAPVVFHTPPVPGEIAPPANSNQGRNALRTSVTAGDGCYDVARSALPPRPIPTDPPSFRYYAYGLDAVGWATASPLAPPNLTRFQLQRIYDCTFTDWSQVGGAVGPILRYWPQPGSDVRQLFATEVLGFDPTVFPCPLILTPENTGEQIALVGDQPRAIVPFAGSKWDSMANGLIPDVRFGQAIRDLDGQNITFFDGLRWRAATPAVTGNPAAPIQESNVRLVNPVPPYVGVSYAFNVVDTTHVSIKSAIRFVGFDNVAGGSTSPLCSGGRATLVGDFGFGPLDTTADPLHNIPGTNCREYWP